MNDLDALKIIQKAYQDKRRLVLELESRDLRLLIDKDDDEDIELTYNQEHKEEHKETEEE
jgi:hypothetical protein